MRKRSVQQAKQAFSISTVTSWERAGQHGAGKMTEIITRMSRAELAGPLTGRSGHTGAAFPPELHTGQHACFHCQHRTPS